MDWNIFWTAFGAIGTTIGSLITATAVIVALLQYRQPLLKKIELEFTGALADFGNGTKHYYTVTIKNRGIRTCTISSLWIKGKDNNMYMNLAQIKGIGCVEFPFTLEQEETKPIFFEREAMISQLKAHYNKDWIPVDKKLIIYAVDSTGDKHKTKTNIVVKKFLK